MAKIKLTKRNYLGDGYIHTFKDNISGGEVVVPCTKEEYEKLGIKGGSQHNPTLAGHTWLYSAGGTDKVDTPSTVIGDCEYYIKDGKKIARFDRLPAGNVHVIIENVLDENEEIDEAIISDLDFI